MKGIKPGNGKRKEKSREKEKIRILIELDEIALNEENQMQVLRKESEGEEHGWKGERRKVDVTEGSEWERRGKMNGTDKEK